MSRVARRTIRFGCSRIVVRSGKLLQMDEIAQFRSAMLYELASMNHAKGWVQQFHFGALPVRAISSA